ncbi:MAG TPA: PQQ-dependent dehydrogenase, methanol/ethanol family [Candidatus Binataceae bacterium]|nr:PQQ-dependent dehydrogenase, methanol/ethanol family [Candidatus Binataceae bacterium]
MKPSLIAVLLGVLIPAAALAQSARDLTNAAANPSQVITYGMSYSEQRFSPLTKINRANVKRLVPAWSYSMANNYGEEAQPLVYRGVIYMTDSDKTVALGALSGRELWKVPVNYPPETNRRVCCGIVNRGAALYQGKLFRTTEDGHVVALDARSGRELWNAASSSADNRIVMTGAPLIADGVVIVGVSGAEYGIRGYLDGYDAQTGKRLWRHYTVPLPDEPGANSWPDNAAHASGGSSWTTGSYDPELGLVYWGIGNPAPWNPLLRKGDDLYTDSIMALRPRTGQMVWYYQTSPNDPFDHDGVNALVLADLKVDGKPTKVVMQASRNGFFYVLDRRTGKLLAANPYVKVTWADRVDLKSGRPVWSAATQSVIDGTAQITTFPSISGGTNWFPMSYSPLTGLAYVNTLNIGMQYQPLPRDTIRSFKPDQPEFGIRYHPVFPDPNARGYLKAIEPMTGKARWQTPFKSPNWSGTLVTAGGLVFTGELTGQFIAVDAASGKILWSFQTPSGIIGQPITWELKGKQYVTVPSGIGGVYVMHTPDANLRHVPPGGTLWTFKLFDD